MNYEQHYLVNFQYLGFRLHGWQKQPNVKTVHFFVDKTLKFILNGVRFKSIGLGRTDAKVSANDYYLQLFIDKEIHGETFLKEFNKNAPSDIRMLSIKSISDENFNIIQHPKIKEYRYYFSHQTKNHPYAAAFLTGIQEELDIKLMQEAAKLFEGKHNFKRYCTKPTPQTKVEREIICCKIVENTELTASFFPKENYVLIVQGEGFLRNQIRLMMGALFELGKGNYSMEYFKNTLNPNSTIEFINVIAPASGLHLHKISFH